MMQGKPNLTFKIEKYNIAEAKGQKYVVKDFQRVVVSCIRLASIAQLKDGR